MAYEFKKLSDVNTIESINDTLNVLVEDSGNIVKIAANNLVPEDVVIQSELQDAINSIPAPVTSWNDLTDKPFDTIEEVIENQRLESISVTNTYSRSNSVLLGEDILHKVYFDNDIYELSSIRGSVGPALGDRNLTTYPFYISDNAVEGGSTISVIDDGKIHTISVYECAVSETIVTLDEKYIPDTISRTKDIPEVAQADWSVNDESNPAYVKNRTHWIETVYTDGEVTSTTVTSTQYVYLGYPQCIKCTFDGDEYIFNQVFRDGTFYWGKDDYDNGLSPIYFAQNVTGDGGYIAINNDGESHAVTYCAMTAENVYHKIDSKFLPQAAVVANAVGETPTAAEFNALLIALRNAGYLATE